MGVGTGGGDEVYSGVGDEVGEGVELGVGVVVILIHMLNMKSMWRLVTVSILYFDRIVGSEVSRNNFGL